MLIIGKSVQKGKTLQVLSWNVKCTSIFGKQYDTFQNKLNIEVMYVAVILLLSTYPQEVNVSRIYLYFIQRCNVD